MLERLKEAMRVLRAKESWPVVGGGEDPDSSHSDFSYYRRLTDRVEKRDLPKITQERMFKIALYLYDTNLMAKRILELNRDYTVGDGVLFSAEAPEVKQVLDGFWEDPKNKWDLKQYTKALELGLYGEQCYPAFVNEHNGHVRLGYIEPPEIKTVITNPENAEEQTGIKLIGSLGSGDGDGKTYELVHIDDNPKSSTFGRLIGECFFFAINKVTRATRGRSDLLSLADWIDAFDNFLFNVLERGELLNDYVWDVELRGASETMVKKFREQYSEKPKPGSIRFHNEKIKWNAVTPDLKSSDSSNMARTLKNYLLGGAGFPEHWFGQGDPTRASAIEMHEPVLRRLKTRQKFFLAMIGYIFKFAIDQAIIHKVLDAKINTRFSVGIAPFVKRDVTKTSTALIQVVNALTVAEERGWISEETSRKIFANLISEFGLVVSPEEEKKRVEKEEARIVVGDTRKLAESLKELGVA